MCAEHSRMLKTVILVLYLFFVSELGPCAPPLPCSVCEEKMLCTCSKHSSFIFHVSGKHRGSPQKEKFQNKEFDCLEMCEVSCQLAELFSAKIGGGGLFGK